MLARSLFNSGYVWCDIYVSERLVQLMHVWSVHSVYVSSSYELGEKSMLKQPDRCSMYVYHAESADAS